MSQRRECDFEHEVFAQATHEQWLRNATPELHSHLTGCEICADAATVALAIALDRDEVRDSVALPKADRVWWMAQLRARREAAEAAQRPIAAVETAAWICIAALAFLLVGSAGVGALRPLFSAAWDLLAGHALAVGLAAAFTLAIPFAVHLAAGSE